MGEKLAGRIQTIWPSHDIDVVIPVQHADPTNPRRGGRAQGPAPSKGGDADMWACAQT